MDTKTIKPGIYEHDCNECIYQLSMPDIDNRIIDIYVCNAIEKIIVLRYSNVPSDNSIYEYSHFLNSKIEKLVQIRKMIELKESCNL